MNAYIEIIRPGNVVMAMIAIILVAIVGSVYNIPMILSAIAVLFVISAGNVINDVFDYKIDLINRPDRPIPSGRISLKNGRIYAYLLFISAIVCGAIISFMVKNLIPVGIVIFAVIALYAYAAWLKTTLLLGNFLVAFMTCLCFIFGGYCAGLSINNQQIIYVSAFLGFFALLATLGREITKDIEDMEGDISQGAKTFPIMYGTKKSAIIAASLIIIACILSPMLYFAHIFNNYYLVIVAISVIVFLYGSISLLKDQSPENCHKVSKTLKIAMIIAFIAFAIGSF